MTGPRHDQVRDPLRDWRARYPGRSPYEILAAKIADLRKGLVARGVGREHPPYDPYLYAEALGMELREVDLPNLPFDAALFPRKDGRWRILVNLKVRNAARRRFSVAHELAHTLLPEARRTAQFRLKTGHDAHAEIERLADLGAALLLMPPEHFAADLRDHGFCPSTLRELGEAYQVSLEAAALNAVKLAERPCAACFCGFDFRPKVEANATLQDTAKEEKRWRVRRSFHSDDFPGFFYKGFAWAPGSAVSRAAASGAELSRVETIYFRRYQPRSVEVTALPLRPEPPEPPQVLAVAMLSLHHS